MVGQPHKLRIARAFRVHQRSLEHFTAFWIVAARQRQRAQAQQRARDNIQRFAVIADHHRVVVIFVRQIVRAELPDGAPDLRQRSALRARHRPTAESNHKAAQCRVRKAERAGEFLFLGDRLRCDEQLGDSGVAAFDHHRRIIQRAQRRRTAQQRRALRNARCNRTYSNCVGCLQQRRAALVTGKQRNAIQRVRENQPRIVAATERRRSTEAVKIGGIRLDRVGRWDRGRREDDVRHRSTESGEDAASVNRLARRAKVWCTPLGQTRICSKRRTPPPIRAPKPPRSGYLPPSESYSQGADHKLPTKSP